MRIMKEKKSRRGECGAEGSRSVASWDPGATGVDITF